MSATRARRAGRRLEPRAGAPSALLCQERLGLRHAVEQPGAACKPSHAGIRRSTSRRATRGGVGARGVAAGVATGCRAYGSNGRGARARAPVARNLVRAVCGALLRHALQRDERALKRLRHARL